MLVTAPQEQYDKWGNKQNTVSKPAQWTVKTAQRKIRKPYICFITITSNSSFRISTSKCRLQALFHVEVITETYAQPNAKKISHLRTIKFVNKPTKGQND